MYSYVCVCVCVKNPDGIRTQRCLKTFKATIDEELSEILNK